MGILKKIASAFQQVTNENLQASRFRKKIWSVTGVAERDIVRFDRERAMAQARMFCDNDPLVKGIVMVLVDNVVGAHGFNLVMATADTTWNKEVQDAWNEEKDDLDIRGIRSWSKLNRCWQYRKAVDGDVGIYHNYIDVDSGKFYVQTIEADRIRGNKFDYLDQGIEFNEFGRPKRFFVSPRPKDQQDIPTLFAEGTPIDASDFCLLAHYPTERADMVRGVSMLLPMFNSIQDIREIINAMLQKVKKSSFFCLKTTMTPSPTGATFTAEQESSKVNEDGVTRRTRAIAPMTMVDLVEGEDIGEIESSSPNSEFEPFLRFVLRYGGISMGLPLEMMLMDCGQLNYSSMRATREMAKVRFTSEQGSLKKPCSAVFNSWLKYKQNISDLIPPATLKTRANKHRWSTPIWASLDPQADMTAYGLALGYGLTTIQKILPEITDMTFEELVAQRKAEVKAFADAGVPVETGNGGSKPAEPASKKEAFPTAGKGEVKDVTKA